MTIDTRDLNKFLNMSEKFEHITYEDKIRRSKEELLSTKPSEVMKWWREQRDNLLWGIFGGKIYLIGAETWTGKSTFVNQVCNNVASTGVRVVKYSLEDRMEDIGKEEIYYMCNRLRYKQWLPKYERPKFVCGEYHGDEYVRFVDEACKILSKSNIIELDKTKSVTIDDLTYLMEKEAQGGTKLFAIDHLHYFEMWDNQQRLDLQVKDVMHRINEITRKYNVAVLLVAHYRNNTSDWIPSMSFFRDGSAIKQVANVIIQLKREWNATFFYITKYRWPVKKEETEIFSDFDVDTYEYDFKKSEEQQKRELNFKIWQKTWDTV